MSVIVLVTLRNVLNSFFPAEICFFNSCTFLNLCDKTASIAQVFTDLTMLNLIYFLVSFLKNTLCYTFRFYAFKYTT